MMTTILPLLNNFYEKIKELENIYFTPLITIDIDHLIEYIDRNQEGFMRDYGNLMIELLRYINIDIVKLKELINNSSSKMIEDIKARDIPSKISEPLVEAIKLEIENELLLIDILARSSKETLIMIQNILSSDIRSIKASYITIFSIYASLYLIKHTRQYEKIAKLIDLAIKGAEEKDAIVETILIMISPERERSIKEAIKEEGKIFNSIEELKDWLDND